MGRTGPGGSCSDMALLALLRSEAEKRGLLQPDSELDAGQVFTLVRDMPYKRASSREPETTIREWRGTCSGKHYLLKALFSELGLRSRLMACTTESHVDPNQAVGELRTLLEESGGRLLDVHNYLVVETPEGDTIVDATWPLMMKGLGFMIKPDPNLIIQSVGPVNIGFILGIVGMAVTLMLLENRRIPAAVLVVFGGILLGLFIGKPLKFEELKIGFHIPRFFPYGIPSWSDLAWVIPVLVLPQIPMTIGNAILSNTDVMHEYFGERAHRASYRSIANSQGIADIISFMWGGIPMCHGAGGLAAMYRFGARSAGANLMIGGIFVLLGLVFGQSALLILKLLPLSILGVLLVFAGAQLALMIRDLTERKDLFVALVIMCIALAINLAAAFICGIIIAYALKSEKISV